MTGREEEATQVFTFMEMAGQEGIGPPLLDLEASRLPLSYRPVEIGRAAGYIPERPSFSLYIVVQNIGGP